MSTDIKNEKPDNNEVEPDQELHVDAELDEQPVAEEHPPTLEERLESAEAEVLELRDQMLRVAAEFENTKKRMERERQNMLKYSGEHIFRELLPVVDNLERAVAQGAVSSEDAAQNLEAMLEGIKLTLKSLVDTLSKFEVKPMETIGQPFDPNVQEALTMEASDTVPANHVLNEFEKGYHYKDRLLRAARVIVSAGKSNE